MSGMETADVLRLLAGLPEDPVQVHVATGLVELVFRLLGDAFEKEPAVRPDVAPPIRRKKQRCSALLVINPGVPVNVEAASVVSGAIDHALGKSVVAMVLDDQRSDQIHALKFFHRLSSFLGRQNSPPFREKNVRKPF